MIERRGRAGETSPLEEVPPRQVKRSLNWLDTRIRRRGSLARIYQTVHSQFENDEAELVFKRVGDIWGVGVRRFLARNIPQLCLSFFSASAVGAALEAGGNREFLDKWELLRDQVGLSDDPQEMFNNFPYYHVGSWRVFYFAEILNFFQLLDPQAISLLNESEFFSLYHHRLVLPVLANFRRFYREDEEKLWQMAEEKIKFLEEKIDWEKFLRGLKEDMKKGILAALCLPYYQRRLVLEATEKVELEREPFGYLSHQAIMILEKGAYLRAKERAAMANQEKLGQKW
jgi:hypothetical protein